MNIVSCQMRGSTSAPFPGMIVHPQVCPVCLWSPITEVPQPWFSLLWSYLSCQLVGEAGQEYNARQDIGGGSALRLFNRILRSWGKWNTPGQLPQQIWHRSGCLVHLKNLLTCHFLFFWWGKIFLSILHASTHIAALLGRRFEMHWLGQCENSLDTDTRIFPTARRPGQVFALQHWKQSV